MNIRLCNNSSEKNKIGKTLTTGTTFLGTLKEETDIINPKIMIEAEDISGYNYAEIETFGRYYFIESISIVRKNLWRVNLTVDVLESFKTSIKAQKVIICDSEENGASDYIDGKQWKSKVKALTDIINFSSGLNDSGEYILITVGG